MVHAAFATTHTSRSFGARAAAPRLPSCCGEARRVEGHHPEPHRRRQQRLSATGKVLRPTLHRAATCWRWEDRGAAATVHSPPPGQPPRASARRDDACDNISIVSSDSWTLRDQRQVLRERAHEDARTTIEHRRDTRHQSDKRGGTRYGPPSTGGLRRTTLRGGLPGLYP